MKIRFLALFLLVIFPCAAMADDIMPDFKDTLTGDWNGERDKWKAEGIELGATDYFDAFAAAQGGQRILNNLNINALFDGDKLVNVPGLSGLFSVLQTNGSQPSRTLTGAVQRIDDMETEHRGLEIYQVWLQQEFFGGGISMLAGIYDATNEFYSTDASDILINNAYGFGTELAATGTKGGVAIFPTSAAGGRLRLQPTKQLYLQAAVMDGINTAPETREHLRINGDSSALIIGEGGYMKMMDKVETAKIAFGAWRYTDQIGSLFQQKEAKERSAYISGGEYALTEGYILRKPGSNRGLMVFARMGIADREVDRFNYSFSTGLDFKGVLKTRAKSELTFGIADAHLSPVYRESLSAQGIASKSAETALELTYRDYLRPWISLQPDLQYIINPDGLRNQENPTIFGIRTEINF